MAVTQADIDALLSAISLGESKVRFADGREVTYRSVPDMERALGVLRKEVASVPMQRTTRVFVAR
jgi:hypothetical protein